jgi:mannan endo-1,4-beta-mannosidase
LVTEATIRSGTRSGSCSLTRLFTLYDPVTPGLRRLFLQFAIPGILFFLSTLSSQATRFEAESAVLSGNTTITADAGASGGSHVAMGDFSGSVIAFNNVQVSGAGSYPIKIGYRPRHGDKNQDIYVNNTLVTQQSFTGDTGTWLEVTVNATLNDGINSVEIRGNWGWTDFDYIEVDGASAPRLGDTWEAEEATLTAVVTVTDGTASGGEYVNMEASGSIVWNVTAATTDRYTLTIGYRLPYDTKNQVLLVNGTSLGEVVFAGALDQWLDLSMNVNLNAGSNTIEIRPSWGYMHFDFINLLLNPAPPVGDVYEAEDAVLAGVSTGSNASASGGGYVFMEGGGSILWDSVEVPLSGTYALTVGFQLPWDTEKFEHLSVNDISLSDIHFQSTPGSWDEVTIEVALHAGTNRIQISRHWGWLYIDYIRVAELDTDAPWAAWKLVDSWATGETKALYRSLQGLGNRFLFGQANAYSISRLNNKNNLPEQSDVKDITGSHPAFVESDFMWYPDDPAFMQWDMDALRAGYARGAMIGYCWHLRGRDSGAFYKGGADDDLVTRILANTGGARDWYLGLLDSLVIPVFRDLGFPILFRPFHEMSGGWFWWGSDTCTPTEYKQLWRLTVDHIRASGVHNVIYVWAAGSNFGAGPHWEPVAWNFYPGDAYVDIIGMDAYDPGIENWFPVSMFVENLEALTDGAAERSKVCALTETGAQDYPDGAAATYWTRSILNPVKSSTRASRIAYAMTWYNHNWGSGDQWTPYVGIPSVEAVEDFMAFYADPVTIFEDGLPNLYGRSSTGDGDSGSSSTHFQYAHRIYGNTAGYNRWPLDPDGVLDGPMISEVIGSLPPGLLIRDGWLRGVVSGTGQYQFTVMVRCNDRQIEHRFSMKVMEPVLSPMFQGVWWNGAYKTLDVIKTPGHGVPGETALLELAIPINQPSELRFEWDYIKPPAQFAIVGGSLPAGMMLDSKTGSITGTPAVSGEHLLVVSVKDWRGRGYQWIRLQVQEHGLP